MSELNTVEATGRPEIQPPSRASYSSANDSGSCAFYYGSTASRIEWTAAFLGYLQGGEFLLEDSIFIEPRFQGPPESGNGGYVAGRLARYIDSPTVAVRLHSPPLLSTEMQVQLTDGKARLLCEETAVAEARSGNIELDIPRMPSYDEIVAATARYRGFQEHFFPECFVCGPNRDAGDGLRIFPGPVDNSDLVAATWTPDESLQDPDGTVATEFIWAALDCPGAFAFEQPPNAAVLLGELQVTIEQSVRPGDLCALVAWQIKHEGRKHLAATVLLTKSGSCAAIGLATWIEVPLESVGLVG